MFWGSLRKVSDCSLWSNCGPETKAQGCFGNLVFRRTRPLTVRNSGSYNVAYWPIPSSRFYEYTARSETVAKKSLLPLNLHLAIRHDLLPARDFLAQEGAEFFRCAADRIDADRGELPGEVRVLERAADFGVERLHDGGWRAFRRDRADPGGDVETRQSGFVQGRDIGRDVGPVQSGLAD